MIKRNYQQIGFLFIMAFICLSFILFAVEARMGNNTNVHPDLGTAISRVAKENIPAVVHIETSREPNMINSILPFENDPFFRYYFGSPDVHKKVERQLTVLGTGIILDGMGDILTNSHLVANAADVHVLLSNGKNYPATLTGTDSKTDLAVIRIKAVDPLPHVRFGNSDKMDVGNWVVAIGHPRGLDHTVTQGIISAKHRHGVFNPSGYQDFLQTDAAINPGNSGGPLLNLDGDVIGVNAAIVSESGVFKGIGFAIPGNIALHVAKALIADDSVVKMVSTSLKDRLGIKIRSLTSKEVQKYGLSSKEGVAIIWLDPRGPLGRAGFELGDIILEINNQSVKDIESFADIVSTFNKNQPVVLFAMDHQTGHTGYVQISVN